MDNMMTDEVIKRRLLIDGDGMGDDRRFLTLMKLYSELCYDKDTPGEETARKLQEQARQARAASGRTAKALLTTGEGTHRLKSMHKEVIEEIGNIRESIKEGNSALEEVLKLRKQGMEYDALGKLILTKPDRKASVAQFKKLEEEMKENQDQLKKLDCSLEKRKKHIEALSWGMEVLKKLLEEGDDMGEEEEEEAVEEEETTKTVEGVMEVEDETGVGLVEKETVVEVPHPPPPTTTPADKEKYEDLSESDGEQ